MTSRNSEIAVTEDTSIYISEKMFALTERLRKKDYESISPNWQIGVHSQLDSKKILERVELIENLTQFDKSKKILEIGAGAGLLVACLRAKGYQIQGIEPDTDSYIAADQLFRDNQLDASSISNISGEAAASVGLDKFDIVYSFQVLEHCLNPLEVLKACNRALKKNGILYFVVPNYSSFWEGHYAVLWMPFLTKNLAKIYVKLLRRNPDFIDSLSFITPKWTKAMLKDSNFELISLGESVFYNRLCGNFQAFHGDSIKLASVVNVVRKIGLAQMVAKIMVYFGWHYPLIIMAKK